MIGLCEAIIVSGRLKHRLHMRQVDPADTERTKGHCGGGYQDLWRFLLNHSDGPLEEINRNSQCASACEGVNDVGVRW